MATGGWARVWYTVTGGTGYLILAQYVPVGVFNDIYFNSDVIKYVIY